MPCCCSSAPGPMPESCRICGLPIAPADSIVSRRASAILPRSLAADRTPRPARAGLRAAASSRARRSARSDWAASSRAAETLSPRSSARRCAGSLRSATRRSLSPRLKSSVHGMPASSAASRNASRMSHRSLVALDAPLAALPVLLVRAAPVIFRLHENRQHVLPRPAGVAGQLRPLVVVARLAAQIEHRVDRGASRRARLPRG